MDRYVTWTPVQWPGYEHLHVYDEASRIVADGMIIGWPEGHLVRLHYEIVCDDAWRTRRLTLEPYGQPGTILTRDDADRWQRDGVDVAELTGCTDVDISLTPFTNTLPIRRLKLAPGKSATMRAVYVLLEPMLEITTSDQRYTRLSEHDGADYRYQSGSFSADLRVDDDGIVTTYPGLWR